jgi:hypothetical protein
MYWMKPLRGVRLLGKRVSCTVIYHSWKSAVDFVNCISGTQNLGFISGQFQCISKIKSQYLVRRHYFHASYGTVNVSGGTGIDLCRCGGQVLTYAMAMVEYGNWPSPGHFSSFLKSHWTKPLRAYRPAGFKFQSTFKISLHWSEFHKDASNSIYDQKSKFRYVCGTWSSKVRGIAKQLLWWKSLDICGFR